MNKKIPTRCCKPGRGKDPNHYEKALPALYGRSGQKARRIMKARDIVKPAKLLEARNCIIWSAMGRNGIRAQQDLGDQIGMAKTAVSNRFTGKVQWDIDELRKLDRAIHFTDDELLKFVRG